VGLPTRFGKTSPLSDQQPPGLLDIYRTTQHDMSVPERRFRDGKRYAESGIGGVRRVSHGCVTDERLLDATDVGVTFSRHIESKVEEVEPGRAVCHIDVEDIHLNGNGTLHGGVYASLLDNATGLAVAALVGLRTAIIGLDVHFLGAVREGRITCSAEVVHRTRRIATVEVKVRNGDDELVAMGTGTFRIFEKRGNPIV
jgi:uncharacterized protein (TIGR00369 family)